MSVDVARARRRSALTWVGLGVLPYAIATVGFGIVAVGAALKGEGAATLVSTAMLMLVALPAALALLGLLASRVFLIAAAFLALQTMVLASVLFPFVLAAAACFLVAFVRVDSELPQRGLLVALSVLGPVLLGGLAMTTLFRRGAENMEQMAVPSLLLGLAAAGSALLLAWLAERLPAPVPRPIVSPRAASRLAVGAAIVGGVYGVVITAILFAPGAHLIVIVPVGLYLAPVVLALLGVRRDPGSLLAAAVIWLALGLRAGPVAGPPLAVAAIMGFVAWRGLSVRPSEEP